MLKKCGLVFIVGRSGEDLYLLVLTPCRFGIELNMALYFTAFYLKWGADIITRTFCFASIFIQVVSTKIPLYMIHFYFMILHNKHRSFSGVQHQKRRSCNVPLHASRCNSGPLKLAVNLTHRFPLPRTRLLS